MKWVAVLSASMAPSHARADQIDRRTYGIVSFFAIAEGAEMAHAIDANPAAVWSGGKSPK
jgi:hypothetical protein